MKIFLVALGLFVAAAAHATPNTYRIDSQLFIDGKLISSPKIITNAGESAELTQVGNNPNDKLSFKVVPEDFNNDKIKDGILMKFNIEYIYGSRSVKSSPQIIAKSGSEASISIGKMQNKEEVLLKVIATRE